MTMENDFATPNGVRFKISVATAGKWHCLECGQEGFTAAVMSDDAAHQQAELQAKDHSVLCGAGRGLRPQS
jgi:hypothetical protein